MFAVTVALLILWGKLIITITIIISQVERRLGAVAGSWR